MNSARSMLDRSHKLIFCIAIILGISVRLYFALSQIGVETWGHFVFYRTIKEGHILDFYRFNNDSPGVKYVYGPVWMGTMIQYSLFTDFRTLSDPYFWLFSRMPIIIADVLCFLLIYLIGGRSNRALIASIAYFLNPFTILVGSDRASFDSIGCCLLLLSLLLITKESCLPGGLTLALAMLTKPYFYFAWPILFFTMVRTRRQEAIKIAGSSILFFCLISAPFFLAAPSWYLNVALVTIKWSSPNPVLLEKSASGLWYLVFQERWKIAHFLGLSKLSADFYTLWIPVTIIGLVTVCTYLYLNPSESVYKVFPISACLFCLLASPINLPFLLFPSLGTHLMIATEKKQWLTYILLSPLILIGVNGLFGEVFDLSGLAVAASIVFWLSLELIATLWQVGRSPRILRLRH